MGCCPRAGHLAAAAFAPLLDLRCCHRLAGPRFGDSSRFLCCLRFAKPRYTERNLRWLQPFSRSHVSHFVSYDLLEGLPRNSNSFYITSGFPYGIPTYEIIMATNFLYTSFLFNYIHPYIPAFLAQLRTSRSGVGAFLWDFTKALGLHTRVYLPFPLWRRCSLSGFHQSPLLVPFVLSGFGLLDFSDGFV